MLRCDSLEWLTTDLRRGQEPLFVKFSKWNVMSTFNGKLWYGKNIGAVVFGCVSWKLTNCNQRSGYSVCFWVQVAKFANILNTFSLNHFLYSYQLNGNSVLKCDARPTIKVPLIPDQFHTTDLHICKVDSGVKPPRLNGSNIDKPLWLEIEVRTNLKKKKSCTPPVQRCSVWFTTCVDSVLSISLQTRLRKCAWGLPFLRWTSNAVLCFEQTSLNTVAEIRHLSRTHSQNHLSHPQAPLGLLLCHPPTWHSLIFASLKREFKIESRRFRVMLHVGIILHVV